MYSPSRSAAEVRIMVVNASNATNVMLSVRVRGARVDRQAEQGHINGRDQQLKESAACVFAIGQSIWQCD